MNLSIKLKIFKYNRIKLINLEIHNNFMEKVIVSKSKFQKMKNELRTLRNTSLYKRILKSKEELKNKVYTRKDLGF